jgi:hypothetical protein
MMKRKARMTSAKRREQQAKVLANPISRFRKFMRTACKRNKISGKIHLA